jgi:hypothetical protein
MNMKTKIVTLSVAAVLTVTLAGQSFAAAKQFTDLSNTAAREKILVLQENGYVKGVGNDLFAPNETITAAQGIQLIVNAFNLNLDLVKFIKEPKATDYYVKADNNAWYAEALIIAAVNGLKAPGDLDPNQKWTREEFTHNLIITLEAHKKLPMIKIIPAVIVDQDQISSGYEGSVQRALTYKITKLDDRGKFNPKSQISRAEAAEQIYDTLEYIKAHSVQTIDTKQAPTE